jgi:hypothetical protein
MKLESCSEKEMKIFSGKLIKVFCPDLLNRSLLILALISPQAVPE